jgi:hypothetical protein
VARDAKEVKGLNALLRILGLSAVGVAGWLGYLYLSSDRFHGQLRGACFYQAPGGVAVVLVIDEFAAVGVPFYNVEVVGLDGGGRLARTKWAGAPSLLGAADGKLWVGDSYHRVHALDALSAEPGEPAASASAPPPPRACATDGEALGDALSCRRLQLVDGSTFSFERGQLRRVAPGGHAVWTVPRHALTGEDHARPIAAHLHGDQLVLVLEDDRPHADDPAWAIVALGAATGEIRWRY